MCPTFEDARARQRRGGRGLGDGEMTRWQDRIAAVPDLRLAKVMRIRRAIVAHQYDEDAMLERSLGEIHAELGALCRPDDFEGWG